MSTASTDCHLATAPTALCLECGFDPEAFDPGAAAEAVRSLTGRFDQALPRDDGDGGDALRRPLAPGSWSALEHAAHVRDALHALDMRLQRVIRDSRPFIPETPRTVPVGANDQGRDIVLALLRLNAGHLARTVTAVPAAGWRRTGVRAGAEVEALSLAREAVHEGAHHLAILERGLRSIRADRRPVS